MFAVESGYFSCMAIQWWVHNCMAMYNMVAVESAKSGCMAMME